jgi:hypothetical protein
MKRLKNLTGLILIVLLAQACNMPAPTTAPPTEPAAATGTQPPALPTEPPPPTVTTAPLPTAPPALPTETSVPPAPTPSTGQPEAILILEPGPGSRVTSPLRVSGVADPTFEQSLVVSILTADGAQLATTPAQIMADVGQRGPFSVDLPFSAGQEQQGFVQVYAISAKDGGVTHLASVGVTLLPGGTADIRPAPEHAEQIVLLQPGMGATVSGGVVHVEGFGLASFEQTLLVEVLDETGLVLASAPVTVAAPDLGQPGPFSVDLPYTVSAQNAGRVQVRDISPAHGGNTHLTSVEVRLEP